MFKFSVNNYRSFLDQEFDFKRVNILIGENNSGKSSALKFFLLLKQTLEMRNANLVLNGNLVDVGNYKEVVYYHKTKKNISFDFSFDKSYLDFFLTFALGINLKSTEDISKTDEMLKKFFLSAGEYPTKATYEFTNELHLHHTIKTTFYNSKVGTLTVLPHADSTNEPELTRKPLCKLAYHRHYDNKYYEFDKIEFEAEGFMSLVTPASLAAQTKGYNRLFYEIAFLLISQNFIRVHLEKIQFINPLDNAPKRIYYKRNTKANYVTTDLLEKLVELVDNKRVTNDFLKTFNGILKDYGIAENIEVVGDHRLPVVELMVRVKDLLSNITDVGYGVSLQLPILFEALSAELNSGKLFLIEQPEIHLHPKLQAKFIDVLLKIGDKNRFLIETHSEHIVRMLQLIVKEKKYNISADDVSVYYLTRVNKKTVVTKHEITSEGYLDPPFPTGFYDASYSLAKQILY